MQEFCARSLARFRVPRYVPFTDQFPTTVTGKIHKYKLCEASVAELRLDAPAPS
ncbi:MAG TPA: hypothetical protein VK816_03865 [Jatrophihabitantaceae bacterium]|nr:hypothetical protein [Jatrophihabitantaceae bacterium]